ncbi:TnsA-like heteromeric transposase endonuclease subunit [Mycobacterium sp. NPDC051804]|uniref:TnsA-like heteromeric transposase endonuclease subunit n=1 Tax=Mycobacterium sp. NPDC051804 TaxID=3364295 RepID=UPI0037B480A3
MPSSDDEDDLLDALALRAPGLTWTFRLQGTEIVWMWQRSSSPPVHSLEPMRRIVSSTFSRHIPVTAHSMTNGASVHLESGLEHDLFRRLDRDPRVAWMVSQPFRLAWRGLPGRHTPDLLTVDVEGRVTIWDVRAPEKQDDEFRTQSRITEHACAAVGWRYEVFGEMAQAERLNLMWLNGFRREPSWLQFHERQIVDLVSGHEATLGALFDADDGCGELKSSVWHMVWKGALSIDTTCQWGLDTSVRLSVEVLR